MVTTALQHHDDDAYWWFRPRPDQPERFDQQTAFVESQTTGVKWLIGGNGGGTTTVSLYAVARFLMNTPPPRPDTPFWIISNDFELCIETCWREKIDGMGIVPKSEIDYDRIMWYRQNQNMPYRVPLKPWPGRPGKNWQIEFRSFKQNRKALEGRSVGGFLFVEQFPWNLLAETLRGCREYNFPGSKMCEFTPVDPNLSVEIENLIENDNLPPGWEVYRANTECAVEAGHVSREWFNEFFGMIPDEMRETRMTGRFATYEGAVYKGFNHLLHLVDDVMIDGKLYWQNAMGMLFEPHPPNVFYRRGIDWGAGPHNPFACNIGYFNGQGQWFIFEEYTSSDQERTTVDHLCQVQDLWPWPKNNPHYGTAWADPSSPDNIRLAQNLTKYCPKNSKGEPLYSPMAIMRGRNAVHEGIEHVQYLLKPIVRYTEPKTGNVQMQPRLFIHKGKCPVLARQMRTYRWMNPSEQGVNPQNARKEPLKKDDHNVDALRYMLFSEAIHSGNTPSSMAKERRSKDRGVFLAGVR